MSNIMCSCQQLTVLIKKYNRNILVTLDHCPVIQRNLIYKCFILQGLSQSCCHVFTNNFPNTLTTLQDEIVFNYTKKNPKPPKKMEIELELFFFFENLCVP